MGVRNLCLSAILGVSLAGLVTPVAWAAEGCKIRDSELRRSFVGGCNSEGWAEGAGVAKGTAEYVGDFKNGYKHGRGVKIWPWGDRYVGEFVEDRKEGRGTYSWGERAPNAGDSYIGDWRNDVMHGRGEYRWASGERFEGQFESGQMKGPPTPMAIQRYRHQEALKAAVTKPGVVVCREIAIGIGGKQRVRATVVEANLAQMSIAVRSDAALPMPVGGVDIKAGDVFWDKAVFWEPCQ